MVGLLFKFSIRFLIWYLKREYINNKELVIRNDGWTVYTRNKEREKKVKEILGLIK